jgi:hypothetical protein
VKKEEGRGKREKGTSYRGGLCPPVGETHRSQSGMVRRAEGRPSGLDAVRSEKLRV